ncbi:hypothetical protein DTO063F5_4122 [Paecilomyces variotii]|nr:hypothetical protein DTO063F5_4122 [Paecilomyces variotii]
MLARVTKPPSTMIGRDQHQEPRQQPRPWPSLSPWPACAIGQDCEPNVTANSSHPLAFSTSFVTDFLPVRCAIVRFQQRT